MQPISLTGRSGESQMRKIVLLPLLLVLLLLAGATAVFFGMYQKSVAQYTDMRSAEESARSQYADAFSAIAEIQDSLNAIALGDSGIAMIPSASRAEQRLTQPDKAAALERIAQLNASVQRTRDKIDRLEGNLKKSHVRIASLERIVGGLKQNLADREARIAELTTSVESLQTQVAGLQTTVQQDQDTLRVRDQTLEERRREIATVEYVIGTKRDLTKSGVIAARGGVLGIGKTLTPSGHYDASLFTPLDTDQQTVVRTPATRVQVLSQQPVSSYAVQLVDGRVEIHILDPVEFRKVKHLVIMTKA